MWPQQGGSFLVCGEAFQKWGEGRLRQSWAAALDPRWQDVTSGRGQPEPLHPQESMTGLLSLLLQRPW